MSDVIRCLSSCGRQQAVLQHWISFTNIYKDNIVVCGNNMDPMISSVRSLPSAIKNDKADCFSSFVF